jgi:hypothetical protein
MKSNHSQQRRLDKYENQSIQYSLPRLRMEEPKNKPLVTEKEGNPATNKLIYSNSSQSITRQHNQSQFTESCIHPNMLSDQISPQDIGCLINENKTLRHQLENTAQYIQYERLEYQRRLRHLSARIEYLEEIKRLAHSPDQFSNEIKPYHTSKKYLYKKRASQSNNVAPKHPTTIETLTGLTRPNTNLPWIPQTNISHHDREQDIDRILRRMSLGSPSELDSPTCLSRQRWPADPTENSNRSSFF